MASTRTVGDLARALADLDPNTPLDLPVEVCGTVTGAVQDFYALDGTVELVVN